MISTFGASDVVPEPVGIALCCRFGEQNAADGPSLSLPSTMPPQPPMSFTTP
jgi:hypothetical protein